MCAKRWAEAFNISNSPSNSLFVINSLTKSTPACPSRQCYISKLATESCVSVANVFSFQSVVSIAYNWPTRVVVSIFVPSLVIMAAELLSKNTLVPFSPSFNTEIKFDLRFGVCRTSFKVTRHIFPSIMDSRLTLPLPTM